MIFLKFKTNSIFIGFSKTKAMIQLLKAPIWVIILLMLLSNVLMVMSFGEDLFISSILNSCGIIIYGIYPLAIGLILPDYLPKKVEISTTFFTINWVIWIGTFCFVNILFAGNGIQLEGLAALPIFYVFFAAIYVFLFPLKVLKSVQKRSEVSFGESIGMAFLLFFWPIGIWMIHPEVKKIMDTQVPTEEIPS